MELELKVKLVAAIKSWMNKNTVLHMTNAAESVFDACLESQQYGIKNGNFEDISH